MIVFKGDEKPAKEWECVLIYDEATQTFTLEKLDSLVNLNFDAKVLPRTRPAAPSRTSSSSSSRLPHAPLCLPPVPRVCTRARHAMLTRTPCTHSPQRLVFLRRADATTLPGAHGG